MLSEDSLFRLKCERVILCVCVWGGGTHKIYGYRVTHSEKHTEWTGNAHLCSTAVPQVLGAMYLCTRTRTRVHTHADLCTHADVSTVDGRGGQVGISVTWLNSLVLNHGHQHWRQDEHKPQSIKYDCSTWVKHPMKWPRTNCQWAQIRNKCCGICKLYIAPSLKTGLFVSQWFVSILLFHTRNPKCS